MLEGVLDGLAVAAPLGLTVGEGVPVALALHVVDGVARAEPLELCVRVNESVGLSVKLGVADPVDDRVTEAVGAALAL